MTDRRFETINKTLEALSSRLDRAFKRIEDFKQGRIDYMVKVNTLEQLLKDHFAKCPYICLLYTSPSPRDLSTSRMPSSA